MADETEVEVKNIIVRDNTVPAELGRDVMYVLSAADSPSNAGQIRPAKIVALVDDGSHHGLVNLQIFTNGGFDQLPNVHHAKNIVHDEEEHENGTWHWPPPRMLVFQTRTKDNPMELLEFKDPEDTRTEGDARTAAHAEEKGYAIGEPPPSFAKEPETSEGLPFDEEEDDA